MMHDYCMDMVFAKVSRSVPRDEPNTLISSRAITPAISSSTE